MNDNRFYITNKIITLEQIKEISEYFEKYKEEYLKLFKEDKEKNQDLSYSEKREKYSSGECKVTYSIQDERNNINKLDDYQWFSHSLETPQDISNITIEFSISYFDYSLGYDTSSEESHKHGYIELIIYDNSVYTTMTQKGLNDEMNKINSYVNAILNRGEDRYNDIIKKQNIINILLSLSIGFFFSYILIIILLLNKDSTFISSIFNNPIIIFILQLFCSVVLGSIFAFPILSGLYENIAPISRPFKNNITGEYNYKKDVSDFTEQSEVFIGKKYLNSEKRNKIRKIYEISKKILLFHIIISLLFMLILYIIK